MAKIGFIGLGNMGGPMAANLVKAGHEVSVFDLVPASVETLVKQGASAADSAKQVAADKDIVVSMLPAGKHVEALYLGEEGLVQVLDKRTLVIDSSTIDAATAKRVGAGLGEAGIAYIDAPVSGGVGGAIAWKSNARHRFARRPRLFLFGKRRKSRDAARPGCRKISNTRAVCKVLSRIVFGADEGSRSAS